MLLVRKTLTEILLEVTNEKILEISNETLSKYRKKGRPFIIMHYIDVKDIGNLNLIALKILKEQKKFIQIGELQLLGQVEFHYWSNEPPV